MRVLGIDPGSNFTGFGVVEERAGKLACVGHGVIHAGRGAALEQRLKEIFKRLMAAVEAYGPEAVAVEGLFSFKNARSALVLGHARGVALLAAAETGLPVFEYAPALVKKSVGAKGSSSKDAVARMIGMFLGVEAVERIDASDALAVAICHLNHARCRAGLSLPPRRRSRSPMAAFGERLKPACQRFGAAR